MSYLLIGRVNAGKSSIFNLLSSKNINIIHSEEGTTRDWHKEIIKNSNSYIYDTPGVLINEKKDLLLLGDEIIKIIENEISSFLYVIDYKNGFNQIDNFSINQIRKFSKKIILIVNKFDNYKIEPSNEFLKYGISNVNFISCSHKFGLDNLKNKLNNNLKKVNIISKNDLSIAIFGKPNSGKSTFLNTSLGFNRSLTSPIANTTSDFVTDYLNYKNKRIKIIDTAGIGKKANIINKSINYLSIKKSFDNISIVDYALILIDANESLDRQDKRIIKLVSEKSKSVILIFNKIDLIEDEVKFKKDTILYIENTFSEIKNIKFFFISALNKSHTSKILDYIFNQFFYKKNLISTSKLNSWLKKVVTENQHPMVENKRINFKYAVQVKDRPITIKIFCSYPKRIKDNYKRYLSNNFNYHFKVLNQKTKFIFSSSINPYI